MTKLVNKIFNILTNSAAISICAKGVFITAIVLATARIEYHKKLMHIYLSKIFLTVRESEVFSNLNPGRQ